MKVSITPLEGLMIVELDVYEDERGYFYEAYNKSSHEEVGINTGFVQDNLSKSRYGTIRGLHYQVGDKAQGKLCQVIKGKALEVAVDIRFKSPTFGQHFAIEISDQNKKQLWVPPGFAHGFSTLSEELLFLYKCTNYYSKEDERCIIYNDPDLNINWKVDNPVVSDKDMKAALFIEIEEDFTYKAV